MRLPACYLRKVRIPLVTLGTERITVFGAPAARAHIQHIFLFILRFSPHSSPSVKAKPPTASLTSDVRRNANAHTFSTFFNAVYARLGADGAGAVDFSKFFEDVM
jgi:hypothetical protein